MNNPSTIALLSFAVMGQLRAKRVASSPLLPSPKTKLPPKDYAAAKSKKRAQRLARRKNRR